MKLCKTGRLSLAGHCLAALLRCLSLGFGQQAAQEPGGSIRLRVTPETTQAQAWVYADPPAGLGRKMHAVGDGEYRLAGLPAGRYIVTVTAPWYVPEEVKGASVEEAQETTLHVALGPAGRVMGKALPLGTRLAVMALKSGTSRIVGDAVPVKDTGEYLIDGLPKGSYDLLISGRDLTGPLVRFVALPPGDLDTKAIETIRGIFREYGSAQSADDWLRLRDLHSADYQDPVGTTYADFEKFAELVSKRQQEAEEQGSRSEEEFTFTYEVTELKGGAGEATAICRCTVTATHRHTAEERKRTTWLLFGLRKENDGWLITWSSRLDTPLLPVRDLVIVPDSQLAGFDVEVGETTALPDVELSEFLPKTEG